MLVESDGQTYLQKQISVLRFHTLAPMCCLDGVHSLSTRLLLSKNNLNAYIGIGCGTIGAFDNREPRFESSHQQF